MKSKTEKLKFKTHKQFEIMDITAKVREIVESTEVMTGTVTVYSGHTTASIKINQNEPLLLQDIMNLLYRLAPVDINYAHDLFENRSGIGVEERSNGRAHVAAFLLGSSETVPIRGNGLLLGKKQSIFFVELDGPRERETTVIVTGE
jgi:secondary thiamine-phosphate synthase enzyme